MIECFFLGTWWKHKSSSARPVSWESGTIINMIGGMRADEVLFCGFCEILDSWVLLIFIFKIAS